MNSIRPISRGLFAVMGLALFLLKFNLDRLVLRSPSWSISNYLYFLPGTLTLSNTQYSPGLLALAVPFVAVGALSTIVLGLVMFGLAVEGVICLAMAAPFALVLGCLGGAVGHLMRRAPTRPRAAGASLIALPLALGVEHAATPRPETLSVTTAINIAATPEVVWEKVIRFRELREPQEWLFPRVSPIRCERGSKRSTTLS
jgi:hypothetical protein